MCASRTGGVHLPFEHQVSPMVTLLEGPTNSAMPMESVQTWAKPCPC